MKPADVVVVGAGPAGTSAAMLLARAGYEVALFDRATFPRDKPCGEFLNPAACDLLADIFNLGADELLGFGARPVSHVRLQLGQDVLEIPMLDTAGGAQTGVTLSRLVLDSLLLDRCRQAGVQIYEGHAARSLTRNNRQISIAGTDDENEPFECSAKLVLAADGTHSFLARHEGLTKPVRYLAGIGFVAHLEGLSSDRASDTSTWMFPSTGDGVLFGFVKQADGTAVLSAAVPKNLGRQIAADPQAFAENLISRSSQLQKVTSGAQFSRIRTTPCFGHRLTRTYSDQMLFLGDAARFVDPFTGEGIHHALESGLLAARSASNALSSGDTSNRALSSFERDRSELNRRYSLCAIIQAICVRPHLVNALGERLRTNPALAETLIGALVDLQSAKRVLNANFVWQLLNQRRNQAPRSILPSRSS